MVDLRLSPRACSGSAMFLIKCFSAQPVSREAQVKLRLSKNLILVPVNILSNQVRTIFAFYLRYKRERSHSACVLRPIGF